MCREKEDCIAMPSGATMTILRFGLFFFFLFLSDQSIFNTTAKILSEYRHQYYKIKKKKITMPTWVMAFNIA